MGSLLFIAVVAANIMRLVTVIMGSFPWSLNSSFSVTDPRLDTDPSDPALVIFVLFVKAPCRLFPSPPCLFDLSLWVLESLLSRVSLLLFSFFISSPSCLVNFPSPSHALLALGFSPVEYCVICGFPVASLVSPRSPRDSCLSPP